MTNPNPDTQRVAPHPPLAQYYVPAVDEATPAREGFVRQLFDETASDYDRVERIVSFGTGAWYRRKALERAGLRPGHRVVDVGVGTGLVAREAARLVDDPTLVTGVDPSPGMLANAEVPQGVRLLEGRAESMPLPDASADFVTMGYALRHVGDLVAAFTEMKRVLVPGGTVCLLEITVPERGVRRWLLSLYMGKFAPVIARVFGRTKLAGKLYDYYWATTAACVPPAEILAALERAGLAEVRRHVELGVFSEYLATRPAGS